VSVEPEAGLCRPIVMMIRLASLAVVAVVALAILPARATSNYEYKSDEYVVLREGVAPNKRMSLASHGEGDLGGENFHVWLMAEPSHRRKRGSAMKTQTDSFTTSFLVTHSPEEVFEAINDVHLAQVLTYLKLADLRLGLIMNFHVLHLRNGIRRVANKYVDSASSAESSAPSAVNVLSENRPS